MVDVVKFWSRVDVCGINECWPWLGAVDGRGYGVLRTASGHSRAHRVAWRLRNGAIPDGAVVRHACDNPRCVNPRHLAVGTQRDNVRDTVRRGRGNRRRGEGHPNAKLTDAQAKEIRARLLAGETAYALAREYPVSRATIGKIGSGGAWSHV